MMSPLVISGNTIMKNHEEIDENSEDESNTDLLLTLVIENLTKTRITTFWNMIMLKQGVKIRPELGSNHCFLLNSL